ncbi:FAD-dependent monooxygenase [Edaphobacter paludis]|uniref:FAD-dependent monooxygenase n=1 Tax=Edaphobacter paludis TaxID=3035702 RepID=A0AAU7DEJ4_9BACT
MKNNRNKVDILIVGAGPVGLFLANECARRGLQYRIVEERSSQSEYSKALAIFPRTLEIFDMAGIVNPFLDVANPVKSVAVVTRDITLARLRFEPEESPYGFVAMVPQNVTERLLVEELKHRGGMVEYNTAFFSATQQDGNVVVTLDHNGEVERITASFVVGCDGAHSKVRKTLNVPLEGGDYETPFMLADIETNDALPGDELQLCPSEFGPVAIFPMSATRRRIVATIEQPQGDAPNLELVQKILHERASREIEAHALHWSSYFRIHHRHAAKLRDARIFIAGDAAHIHSPFGGQGMNTGLHDVWNLIWKLDLHLQGYRSEELLNSYAEERIPVIKSVIQTTDLLTKAMGTSSVIAQALRDAAIPIVSRLAPFQHAFVERLSGLGIAYRSSPIIEGSGERYLDDSMRGGNGICGRFLLVTQGTEDPSITDAAKLICSEFDDLVEWKSSRADPPKNGVKLVRPDGYLAFSSRCDDGLAAMSSVRSILMRVAAQPQVATA